MKGIARLSWSYRLGQWAGRFLILGAIATLIKFTWWIWSQPW
jgi:hypothetical protein